MEEYSRSIYKGSYEEISEVAKVIMANQNQKKLSAERPRNKRNFLIILSICALLIILSFSLPVVDVFGVKGNLFSIIGLVGGLDSASELLGIPSRGSVLGLIFLLLFLPAILVIVFSYLNLLIKNRGYAIFSMIISILATVYTIVLMMSMTTVGIGAGPFLLQILCYIVISVIIYIYLISKNRMVMNQSQIQGVYSSIRGDVMSNGKEQIKDIGKKIGSSINKVVEGGVSGATKSKYEIENARLKGMIKDIKADIGEYMYNAGVSDEDIERYIKEIDDNYIAIGKNKEEILKKEGQKVCEHCRNISSIDSKFCNICGNKYEANKIKDDEHYLALSKEKLNLKKKTNEIKALIDENERKLDTIEKKILEIGEKAYQSAKEFDEDVEKRRNDIRAFELKIEENKKADLEEKGLMECSNCKSIISNKSNFCDNCGVKISQDEEQNQVEADPENNSTAKHCTKCGTTVDPKDAFCQECGNKLK